MFDIPILHVKDFSTDLVDSLNTDISKEYDRRLLVDNPNDLYRKLSVYDKDGNHAAKTGDFTTPFKNISQIDELEKRIRVHAINYLKQCSSMSDIQEKLMLQHWHHFGWWSCFQNSDSYDYHSHPQFQLVCTYYVNATEGHAPISFKHPISDVLEAWCPGQPNLNLEEVILPKTGDLLIWMPFLEHYVMDYKSYMTQLQSGTFGERALKHSKDFDYEQKTADVINSIDCRKSITIGYQKLSQQNLGYLNQGK